MSQARAVGQKLMEKRLMGAEMFRQEVQAEEDFFSRRRLGGRLVQTGRDLYEQHQEPLSRKHIMLFRAALD